MDQDVSSVGSLHAVDYVVVVVGLIAVIVLGLWSTRKAKRGTAQGYFLAGRNMSWWLVGLSLYVSNIGSASFIGIGGSSAVDGIAVVFYEFTGVPCLVLLGYFFVPVYISSGAYTVPQYLKLRFGGNRLQVLLAILQLIMNLFVHITAELYSGILMIQLVMGWNIYVSIIVLLVMIGIFTVAGGLTAVMHTDALQAIIIILSAFILMIFAWIEVGDYITFERLYMDSIPNTTLVGNTTCGIPSSYAWHIFRPIDTSLPWPGVLFGITILSTYYFCTNQVLVQRCLSAKNITNAKAGCILAAYLKILPMFLIVWPGMISRILYTDIVACVDSDVCEKACDNPAGCSNLAYPLLILGLMPIALKGLMLAAMLAGVISSFTSIFNSTSTMFTLDIWKQLRPTSSVQEEMLVGRVFVLVMVGASILWLPVLDAFGAGQLFVYIQSVTSYIAPPTLACFVCAIGSERTNEKGAFWGLISGFLIGGTRMVLDFVFIAPGCDEEDTRPSILANFHYLHFAIFLFVASFVITVFVSVLTKPQRQDELHGLTWWTRHSTESRCESEKKKDVQTRARDENGDPIYATEEERKMEKFEEEINYEAVDENDAWITFKRCFADWMCGINTQPGKEQETKEEEIISLEEDSKWSQFVNINCIILLAVGGFVFGFFG
ncbi:sodium/glucose cotransporter 4-like [Glandiceps talaboti]